MTKTGSFSSDRNWLVRSATRILGPFTVEEIKELLVSRHISIIDEIRQPDTRWTYIRENRGFDEIVKYVRAQLDTLSENTMTQPVTQNTMTKTDVGAFSDDLTPTPTMSSRRDRRVQEENEIRDVTPQERDIKVRPHSGPAKSYGSQSDARVQQKISGKNALLRFSILALIAVVLVVAGLRVLNKEKRATVDYDGLLKQALKYRSLGLYEDSLNYYRKVISLKEPDFESQVRMAPVMIAIDRQTLVGRRVLEKSLSTPQRSRPEMIEAYDAIGLSYLIDGDLKEADEAFQKASGLDPLNFEAAMNQAFIKMKRASYEEARQEFETLARKSAFSSLSVLGQGLAALETYKNSKNKSVLNELSANIASATAKTGYLRRELQLLQIYVHVLLENEVDLQNSVVQFLTQPLGESDKYSKNILVDSRMAQWDYLERYCADVYQRHSPGPQVKALRAVCLMEVNRDAEAGKLIDEALAESPGDPYVMITQSSYLKKIGKTREALIVLKKPELSTLVIKDQLVGDICVATQDISCTHKAFNELYTKAPNDAFTFAGLAWLANRGADRARTYEYIRLGLKAEPHYLPLLKLRDELESE